MFSTAVSFPHYFRISTHAPQDFQNLEACVTFLMEPNHLNASTSLQNTFRHLFQQANAQARDTQLTRLLRWGIEQPPQSIQQLMHVLSETIELNHLEELVRAKAPANQPFQSPKQWASLVKPFCPKPAPDRLQDHLYSEWRRYRSVALHFIPNLIDIFLGAFNFLDANKKFTTLWEKYLLLDIVYKFFVIPYCLVQVLNPVLGATIKTYVVATVILGAAATILASYVRWIKPKPDEILYCQNLDKQYEKGLIGKKIGQADELQILTQVLLSGSHALITGSSGVGKSALKDRFIQLKHEGKLPQALQGFDCHLMTCGLMMSNGTYNHAELMMHIKEHMRGHDKVIFFLDEAYRLVSNPDAFTAFQQIFLDSESRFILIMTNEEQKKIAQMETFERRIESIELKSTEEQTRLVIRALLDKIIDIPCEKADIEQTVLELSNSNTYLPKIGRAARAEKILMSAVGVCREALSPQHIPPALRKMKCNRKLIKTQTSSPWQVTTAQIQAFQDTQVPYQALKGRLRETQQHKEKISGLLSNRAQLTPTYQRLVHSVAGERRADPLSEKLYLLYQFYVMTLFDQELQAEIGRIPETPVQLNGDLVRRIHTQKTQRIGEQVHEAPVAE